MLNELHNRGVHEVLIACCEGLSGVGEAIRTVYPKAEVQRCIVHPVRASLKWVNYAERNAVAADVRTVYTACSEATALSVLQTLEEKWNATYPTSGRSGRRVWDEIRFFFQFSDDIRRLL